MPEPLLSASFGTLCSTMRTPVAVVVSRTRVETEYEVLLAGATRLSGDVFATSYLKFYLKL